MDDTNTKPAEDNGMGDGTMPTPTPAEPAEEGETPATEAPTTTEAPAEEGETQTEAPMETPTEGGEQGTNGSAM